MSVAVAGRLLAQGPAVTSPAVPSVPVSMRVGALNRLLSDPAATNAVSVVVRGVVTHVEDGEALVQEGGVGVRVELPRNTPVIEPGHEIEFLAAPSFVSLDPEAGLVVAGSVRVLGRVPMPEPEQPWAFKTLGGELHGRWIEVEGVVMQARVRAGGIQIHLTDQLGWTVANVVRWSGPMETSDWWGARLRLRGVVLGRGQEAFRIMSPQQIEVLAPGTVDPFGAPEMTVEVWKGLAKATPARYRLAGVVQADLDRLLYVRSGELSVQVSLLHPFVAGPDGPHRLDLLPPSIPEVRPGDRVELVGSPLRLQPLLLSFCSVRRLGASVLTEAREVRVEDVVTGVAANERVRVQGTLVGQGQVRRGDDYVETLELISEGVSMQVVLVSSRGGQLASARKNDLMEVTGVVAPTDSKPPYIVRVASGADVRSRGEAPDAVRWRMFRTVGVLTGVLVVSAVWIGLLRRSLLRERQLGAERARADAAVRELNTRLEDRVARRTQELAAANRRLTEEIAEKERAQAELRSAYAAERELGELKSRFVSMVSHEFRTPLGVTMSAVELLRNYMDRLPAETLKRLLEDIHGSTLRMAGMMEHVLLLGRVEAGKIEYRPAPIDLPDLGRRLIEETLVTSSNRCPVALECRGDLAGAQGDEVLIRHVLGNLLSNAVKYSPAGSAVQILMERSGPNVIFQVRDRGIGIPVVDQGRMFEAFHRAANVGQIPGSGLGLLLARRCVDLHRGSITFESREGEGTTFVVTLPLFQAPVDAIP